MLLISWNLFVQPRLQARRFLQGVRQAASSPSWASCSAQQVTAAADRPAAAAQQQRLQVLRRLGQHLPLLLNGWLTKRRKAMKLHSR
jgi:hypothetical protein